MFAFHDTDLLGAPLYQKGTLAEPDNIRGRQAVGTVKLHPNGRFAYVANRASSTTEIGGRRVFVGGENNLAVFAIDPATGEPEPIQHIDTRGIHCRNFHIDPSGRLLVASHIMGLPVREGDAIREVPACLSVFRIGEDGKLDFVRKYDVETGDKQMFWMGMVAL
jgi:6-phosphogluconolactonase